MTNKPVSLEVVHPEGMHPVIEFWLVFGGKKQNFWEKVPLLQTTYNVNKIKVPAKKYIGDLYRAIDISMVRGPFTKFAYALLVTKLARLYPDAYMYILDWKEVLMKVDKINQPLAISEPNAEEPKPYVKMAMPMPKFVEVPKDIAVSIMDIPYQDNEAVIQVFAIYDKVSPDENNICVPIVEGLITRTKSGSSLSSHKTIIRSMAQQHLMPKNKSCIGEEDYSELLMAIMNMRVLTELSYDWDKFADKAPTANPLRITVTKNRDHIPLFLHGNMVFPTLASVPKDDALDAVRYGIFSAVCATGRMDCSKPNESNEPKSALEGMKKHMPSSCACNHPFVGKHYPYQCVVINHLKDDALYLSFGLHPLDEKYKAGFLVFDKGVSVEGKSNVARLFDNMFQHGFTEENYMGAYENAKKFYPVVMYGCNFVTFKTIMDVLEHKHTELCKEKLGKVEMLGTPVEKQLGAHLSNSNIYSVTFENSTILITENETGFKMPVARLYESDPHLLRPEIVFLGFKALVQHGITEDLYNAWLELSKPSIKEWRTYSLVEQMVLGAETNWNKKEE